MQCDNIRVVMHSCTLLILMSRNRQESLYMH